jgi:hypothetical protein
MAARIDHLLDKCACRWTSKTSEPGWELEQEHPACRAEHERSDGMSGVQWVNAGTCPSCGQVLEADKICPAFTRHKKTKKEKCAK